MGIGNRTEREQARRVAAYVDGCVIHRRNADRGAESVPSEDREFEALRELVGALNEIEVASPEAFEHTLARRIRTLADQPTAGPSAAARIRTLFRRGTRVAWKGWTVAPAAAVLALGIGLLLANVVRKAANPPVVSAAAIVSRSDAALASIVRPGQLLYRRWKATTTITGADHRLISRTERSIHEWMDGSDFERVAGQSYTDDDQLSSGYTTRIVNGQRRPEVYFGPGVYEETKGVLNLEPTRQDYETAVYRFPPPVQVALHVYLTRQYIYQPINSERRFNAALIEAPGDGVVQLPRALVSSDLQVLNGAPVFRVKLVAPGSITFNWRNDGPPRVRLTAAEILRYVGRDDYLTVRTDETDSIEDGTVRTRSRELVETRVVDPATLATDPFELRIPEGTKVQQQSAFEQLQGVADAMQRLPQFLASRARLNPSSSR